MKMLYILNTTNRVNNFSYSSMIAAQELGIEFHIAGNWTGYNNPADKSADEKKYGIRIHQIDFIRTPYDPRNIKSYRQVGFHFFNGAPKINWMIYYPIEKWLANYTDCIVTMNAEDNAVAKKFKLRNESQIYNVHGVGIDLSEYEGIEQYRAHKRNELGFRKKI